MRRFARNQRGGMAVLLTVMLTGLFGFVSVAVDTGIWYATKRRLQTAADASARAAAHELDRGSPRAAIVASGKDAAAQMGFDPADGAVVRIDIRDDQSVRAVVEMPARLYFAKVLRVTAPVLSASAAAAAPNAPPPCLTVLEPTTSQALNLDKASIIAPTCRIQVNSTSSEAMKLASGSLLDAAQICVTGNFSGSGATVPIDRGCAPLPDPLAAWVPPEPGPCDHGALSITTTRTLAPGVYCGKLQIDKATVTFAPGIYILRNGGLKISGGSRVTGRGVGFLLVGDSQLDIEGGSVVDFVAPVAGAMAGIVFAHD
ncbi:MAG: pilus assembly protein TadG-related protein [Alphaproteobacteria bacterium]